MMVMTAKLNLKKILLILAAAAAVVLSLILLLGGNSPEAPAAPQVSGNEARVKFLRDLGWEAADAPTESTQVRVPKEASQIYERYNNLQKSQGYDLTEYAGKKVMRYVYPISNYPGATAPVYATILVYEDTIIGGDITDTGAGGKIRGFRRGDAPAETVPQPTAAPVPQTDPAGSEPAQGELSLKNGNE